MPDRTVEIDVFCFQNTEIEELKLPASVERVCAGAFRNCTRLRAVSFAADSRLLKIGDRAFSACEALLEIKLPAVLERIGPCAFIGCGRLERVAFAAGSRLKAVEEAAFASCAALAACELPDSLEALGPRAFAGSGLEEFRVPPRVRALGAAAFADCADLWRVEAAPGAVLAEVGEDAFRGCAQLAICELPAGVRLGANAFKGTPLEEGGGEQ